MISVEEALQILDEHPVAMQKEWVSLTEACDRVLATPIAADRDFPPYDRVTMDGVAIDSASYHAGVRRFALAGTVAAGRSVTSLPDAQHALEVMTGAVLPAGCDSVVRSEEVELRDGFAWLRDDLEMGRNIHRQASDKVAGDVLVPAGQMIRSAEIGLAAAVGQSHLQVWKIPDIAIITTGDELVPVEVNPALHQVRRSNGYALAASLRRYGSRVTLWHVNDEYKEVEVLCRTLRESYQILIFSGGTSAGHYDFLPEVLPSIGIEERFYKVRQRPGKPLWFGCSSGHYAFCLPGNPVSTLLCLERYVKYWLDLSLGQPDGRLSAVLSHDFLFEPDLTYFLQVQLSVRSGTTYATPVPGGGSGDLTNLGIASGFIELPAERREFFEGESFPLLYIS